MKHTLRIFPIVLLFLSTACQAKQDRRILTIDSLLTQIHNENKFNGNILIAENNKLLYEKSFGYQDYEKKIDLNASSISNIASVSKTFTATLVFILEERGLLDLDDNILLYLDEFPYKGITIRHLLTHTSGLYMIQRPLIRDVINRKGYSNEEVIDKYKDIKPPLDFEPGYSYNYSNTNFILLGLIIERVSGQKFHQFLKHEIFAKAGMNDSYLGKNRVPLEKESRLMNFYRMPTWLSNEFINIDDLQDSIDEEETFKNTYGPSNIYSTTRDLLKFHTALMNKILLSESSLKKMYTPYSLKNGQEYTVNPASNYPAIVSQNWRVAKDSSEGKIVFHAGGFRGGRSFFIRNLDKNQCIIMLTNNSETERYNFTFPMKILNNQEFQLDKKSLARIFANTYIDRGLDSAIVIYKRFKNDKNYLPFVDWDFEEIGAEFTSKDDHKAAIALYQIYTQEFPEELYSWTLLGDAYLEIGNKTDARVSYEKALDINPNSEEIKGKISKL